MKIVYFGVYVHIIVRGSRLCSHDRVHMTRLSESYSEAAYSQSSFVIYQQLAMDAEYPSRQVEPCSRVHGIQELLPHRSLVGVTRKLQ